MSNGGTRAGRPGLCPVRARRAPPPACSRATQLPDDGLDDPAEVTSRGDVPNPSKCGVNSGCGECDRPAIGVDEKALQEAQKVVECRL
jgi:hypothetical protein